FPAVEELVGAKASNAYRLCLIRRPAGGPARVDQRDVRARQQPRDGSGTAAAGTDGREAEVAHPAGPVYAAEDLLASRKFLSVFRPFVDLIDLRLHLDQQQARDFTARMRGAHPARLPPPILPPLCGALRTPNSPAFPARPQGGARLHGSDEARASGPARNAISSCGASVLHPTVPGPRTPAATRPRAAIPSRGLKHRAGHRVASGGVAPMAHNAATRGTNGRMCPFALPSFASRSADPPSGPGPAALRTLRPSG